MRPRPRPITLMAMSGVGKTHLAGLLAKDGWHHHSCDFVIGEKLLGPGRVTPDNLRALSAYIGQVGKGALSRAEFKKRQRQYIEAERDSLMALPQVNKLVVDSTGSLCEIEGEALFERLARETTLVYIKAGPEEEAALLETAKKYPKPLYFPPDKFVEWLKGYMDEKKIKSVDEIEPDDFSRWVFPKLFHSRLPKYQALADKYGITVPSARVKDVKSAEELLEVISEF